MTTKPQPVEPGTGQTSSQVNLSRRHFVGGAAAGAGAAAATALSSEPAGAQPADHQDSGSSPRSNDDWLDAVPPDQLSQETSHQFAGVGVEPAGSYAAPDSDGDLWPSCWADDDYLYTANGDGRGFSEEPFKDVVVNRISGTPETGLEGEKLAEADDVATIWGDPEHFNRKPTGMVCVQGVLYLAVQDLRHGKSAFDEAPKASISRSDDHGKTWKKTKRPMFTDHRFTTIFFLDFGQDSEHAVPALGRAGRYVYAYGLDWNWRPSNSGIVPHPRDVYLARVRPTSVQDRDRWEFFTGTDAHDRPQWSSDITAKVPVLHDPLYRYTDQRSDNGGLPVIGQGGVLYNALLKRYILTSWTNPSFEFYESPTPWGPWRRFKYQNAGLGGWRQMNDKKHTPKNGGYATTFPSKYVSKDGTKLWMQSNWWTGKVPSPEDNYNFNLREVRLVPYHRTHPRNDRGPDNLARTGADVITLEICAAHAHAKYLNDGKRSRSETSDDGTNKNVDYWGYTFSRTYRMNKIVYVTGPADKEGGWFSAYGGGLRVQVRRDFDWIDVQDLKISPEYPYDSSIENATEFTLTFADTWGDGIRIIGQPGGSKHYTSVAELEVFFS